MIQDHYVPSSVEQKTKRIESEKKELESERAQRKELIKKEEKNGKQKVKNIMMN